MYLTFTAFFNKQNCSELLNKKYYIWDGIMYLHFTEKKSEYLFSWRFVNVKLTALFFSSMSQFDKY